MTREQLRNAPCNFMCDKELFDYLYIIPTRRKHDSGYRIMEIVGYNAEDNKLVKLSTFSDVVQLGDIFLKDKSFDDNISIDIEPENNYVRIFTHRYRFRPVFQVSSCTFELVRR